MGYNGVPYWVSKQNEALIESGHIQLENQYLDKIKALEKENTELKKENSDLKQRLKDFDPI